MRRWEVFAGFILGLIAAWGVAQAALHARPCCSGSVELEAPETTGSVEKSCDGPHLVYTNAAHSSVAVVPYGCATQVRAE